MTQQPTTPEARKLMKNPSKWSKKQAIFGILGGFIFMESITAPTLITSIGLSIVAGILLYKSYIVGVEAKLEAY